MPTTLPAEDLTGVSAADGAAETDAAATVSEGSAAEGSTDTTSQGAEAVETAAAEGGSALAAPDAEASADTDDDDEGEAMVNPEDIASVIGESIALSNLPTSSIRHSYLGGGGLVDLVSHHSKDVQVTLPRSNTSPNHI
jgi:hypothetical protein